MHIRKLILKNFRNYNDQTIAFNDGTTILYGGNAQGKTNALEAIFLCSSGRSHRSSREKEMIKTDAKYARVYAEVEHFDGVHTIEIIISRTERKRILLNGIPVMRVGEMMGHLCSVIFSPEDLKLVKEGPSERRRFMDFEISQANKKYFYNLQRYNKILDERNSLLKCIMRDNRLKSTLNTWNEQLCEAAIPIIISRNRFCKRVSDLSSEIHYAISGNNERLSIVYNTNATGSSEGDLRQNIFKNLYTYEKEDITRGNTSIGPHRDDLILKLDNVDIRAFGSQGQQRTAALALKLAEIGILKEETGETPVLLLDDVFSELDTERQKYLIDKIKNIQTIVTCTGIDHTLFKFSRLLFVNSGRILEKTV